MALLRKNGRTAKTPPHLLDDLMAAEAEIRRLTHELADTALSAAQYAYWVGQRFKKYEAEIALLQAREGPLAGIPQHYQDALARWPWIECRPEEWDNRTSAENAVWLIARAMAVIADLEFEVTNPSRWTLAEDQHGA